MTKGVLPAAAATRERLLDAAEQLFAREGFAGTSIRAITRAAGCNLAAVSYHFGGKTELYREVLRRRLGALRSQRIASVRRTLVEGARQPSIEAVLRAFADAFLEPLVGASGGRRLVVLLGRELLDPQLEPDLFRDEMMLPVRTALLEALTAADPRLDRRRLRMSLESFVAQLTHVLHLERFADALDVGAAETFGMPELVEHIVRFTAAGIRETCRGGHP